MNKNVIIRHATFTDIKSVSSILAASWKSAYRGIINDSYLDTLEDDHWASLLTVGMTDDSLITMALEENRHMIGAAVLTKTDDPATIELTSIYLHPDRIGRGYGTIFYKGIESEIRNLGYQDCVLDVLENNSRAIRFYTKNGFVHEGNLLRVPLGRQEYTCKIMKKSLS